MKHRHILKVVQPNESGIGKLKENNFNMVVFFTLWTVTALLHSWPNPQTKVLRYKKILKQATTYLL